MANDIERTVIETKGVCKPIGSYNHAVSVRPGRLLFIAGQVALDEAGELVGKGDFPAQVRQTFQNLERILESAGGSLHDVVQFTTYLVHSQDFEELKGTRKAIYDRAFPKGDFPPNTLLIIDRLATEDFLIEIQAIAALP